MSSESNSFLRETAPLGGNIYTLIHLNISVLLGLGRGWDVSFKPLASAWASDEMVIHELPVASISLSFLKNSGGGGVIDSFPIHFCPEGEKQNGSE